MTNDTQHPDVDSGDPAETETPTRVRTRRSPRTAALAVDAPATEVGAVLPGAAPDAADDAGPEVRRRTRPAASRRRTPATPAPVAESPADDAVAPPEPSAEDATAVADEPTAGAALTDDDAAAAVDTGDLPAAPVAGTDAPASAAEAGDEAADDDLPPVAVAVDEPAAGDVIAVALDEPAPASDEPAPAWDEPVDDEPAAAVDEPVGGEDEDAVPGVVPQDEGVWGEVVVGEPGADADGEVVVGAVEVSGVLEEPELDVEAEGIAEPALMVRRRRRRRAEGAEDPVPEQTEPPLLDSVAGEPPADAPAADAPAADEAPVLERELDRAVEAVDARDRVEAGVADSDEISDSEEADAEEGDAEGEQRPRRRRRGGRGRGRRGGSRPATSDADAVAEAGDEGGEASGGEEPSDSGRARRGKARVAARDDAGPEPTAEADADSEAQDDTESRGTPSTRLAARGRGRGRSRPGERPGPGGGGARGRRPAGTVSEETRRAIAEAPPKKMLVSVGEKRTQVVVLEERNLVEHYVTRREDVSYVGNIYVGRVQNVLPGMEAAFVDIGKGRNGVLYAGEVNYDEADLEGELPRIEQTLKPGQTVLVQVTKDPMGTKGARLTQQLSIAGRYCVLAPHDGMLGISRKLPEDERERLRKILKSIKPDDYGLIVRTAADGATREQLEDDVARLVRIWEGVSGRAEAAEPLQAVYEEPELVIRVIRDVFGPDYRELVVDDEVLGDQIRGYLADVSPELVDKVSVYAGEEALFTGYEVTNQIRRALEKKVWLASGGYLIVEKTEAMWVIDVNTGKFVGKSNLEETVLKNNLEAAAEIARQLRLRDMGGIIVIDFVDMLVPANRDEVLKRFKRELARDKTKSRVMEISKLGLVQMTRKNVSQGLNESFTTVCECCDGRGAQIVESMLG